MTVEDQDEFLSYPCPICGRESPFGLLEPEFNGMEMCEHKVDGVDDEPVPWLRPLVALGSELSVPTSAMSDEERVIHAEWDALHAARANTDEVWNRIERAKQARLNSQLQGVSEPTKALLLLLAEGRDELLGEVGVFGPSIGIDEVSGYFEYSETFVDEAGAARLHGMLVEALALEPRVLQLSHGYRVELEALVKELERRSQGGPSATGAGPRGVEATTTGG